jgi:23S rRNA pseudouridine1911/1915/1917 synthase
MIPVIDDWEESIYTCRMIMNALPILYQDHHLLVVNKPPGLVIHPTYKHAEGTMWDRLLSDLAGQEPEDWKPVALPDKPEWARAPQAVQEMLREQQRQRYLREEGLLPRPCLLHRLDKDTSGVVALARTERARRHFSRQFQDHRASKRYLALVSRGAPQWAMPQAPFHITRLADGRQQVVERGADLVWNRGYDVLLDGPLKRDPLDRRRSIVLSGGQSAQTWVKPLVVGERYTLLEARPVTGRTHQIRAHLAAAGYSIVGDATYGVPEQQGQDALRLHRQFLHAASLELRRYPDNLLQRFDAPLADDLTSWLVANFPEGLETLNARHTELAERTEFTVSAE